MVVEEEEFDMHEPMPIVCCRLMTLMSHHDIDDNDFHFSLFHLGTGEQQWKDD